MQMVKMKPSMRLCSLHPLESKIILKTEEKHGVHYRFITARRELDEAPKEEEAL